MGGTDWAVSQRGNQARDVASHPEMTRQSAASCGSTSLPIAECRTNGGLSALSPNA